MAPKTKRAAPADSEPEGKRLRVKLTGAGNCTRQMQESTPSSSEPGAAVPSAAGTDAVDASAAASTVLAAGATAAATGTKFEVGDTIILHNGSLCYEAEVLQVTAADVPGSKKGAAGRKKEGESALGCSYQIRYLKWPRRPEEWVSDQFVYAWSEALAKGATNRPPRKLMWVEQKGAPRGGGLDEGEAEDDAKPEASEAEAKAEGRRSGRAPKPSALLNEAAPDDVGRKRQRKPSEKAGEKAKDDAAARHVNALERSRPL